MKIYRLRTDKRYPYDKNKYIEDIEFHFEANHSISSISQGYLGNIEIDYGQSQALILNSNGKKSNLLLGTKDACNRLRNTDTNAYYVDSPPHPWDECELPYFLMRRDNRGAWHARCRKIRDIDLILGPSELISFELLANAISFFYKTAFLREKAKLEVESLATFVCDLWHYPL
ncbi:MAG: hypothetical protein WBG32_12935 [Nodosilinea sp.]